MAEGGSYNGNHNDKYHDDEKHNGDPPDEKHNGDPPDEKQEEIEKVAKETEVVFRDFLYRRLKSRNGFEDSDMSVANIPPLSSLADELDGDELDSKQKEQFEHLGKQLAEFGDVIENKYRNVFVGLISNLNLAEFGPDVGFDKFCSLAKRLFADGINWGRIVALLCFGYHIALTVIKSGTQDIRNFMSKIVFWVVRFLVMENIIQWIIRRGGWLVGFDPNQSHTEVWMKRFGAIAVLTAVCYACYRFNTK